MAPGRPELQARAAVAGPKALILYDSTGTYAWQGELYATYAANLVGHFGSFKAEKVSAYAAGEMAAYDAVIYVGSTYNEPLPTSFMNDVLASTTPIVWVGQNIWEPMQLDFNRFVGRFGFAAPSLDASDFASVEYKGVTLTRSSENLDGVVTFGILDPTKAVAIAQAVRADGTKVPWALRAGNLTYFAEVPFPFAEETDRVHVFEDVLFDALAPCTPVRHRAMLRLEDILPTDDPKVLHDTVDYLASQGVPFGFGVISEFYDPLGVMGKAGTVVHLKDRPQLVKALQYAQSKGGVLIEHGYTHQYSNVRNPYDGLSADDGEFFIFTVNSDNTLNYIRPVPEDSTTWATNRVAAADKEFANAKMSAPTIWTTPHYGASAADYKVFSARFPARWERALYFSGVLSGGAVDASHFLGMYYPYVARDVYGGTVLPENSGSYETDAPLHLVPDILAAARANLAVRDGIAGMFYHPFQGLTPLKQIVTGVKALGYTYVSPASVISEKNGPYAPCMAPVATATAGNGRIDLSWTLPSDGGSPVTSYKVYRGTAAGGETLLATLGNVKTYADTAVTSATRYYYKVTATTALGTSPMSAEVSAIALGAPGAPVLTATGGPGVVHLSWTAPADNGQPLWGYKVYRGTASGAETIYAWPGLPTTFDDTSVTGGTAYFYKVSAVNAVGEGAPSNEASATMSAATVPGTPTLTVTAGAHSVLLSWTVPPNGGSPLWGYKVYRGTASGGETIYAWPGTATTLTDASVVAGTRYYYTVSAVNAVGEGSQSGEFSAVPT
jgi:uncharacterized protein YdaL/fibronectin type 3 domain-containing protein